MPFHMMVWKYYCSNNVLIMGSQYSESIWIGMELIHYQKSKIAANMETPCLRLLVFPQTGIQSLTFGTFGDVICCLSESIGLEKS